MGAKLASRRNTYIMENQKNQNIQQKNEPHLTEIDYMYLTRQTGISRAEIRVLFDKFHVDNPQGRLNKEQFIKLYTSMRYESVDTLQKIGEHIFRVFDKDGSNYITFDEFLIAFAITSKGDLKKRLEMAFNLYDCDKNGYLDSNEIKTVFEGMIDLIGANKAINDTDKVTKEIMNELDVSKDNRISKDEFIYGLLKNFSLRCMMSPFS